MYPTEQNRKALGLSSCFSALCSAFGFGCAATIPSNFTVPSFPQVTTAAWLFLYQTDHRSMGKLNPANTLILDIISLNVQHCYTKCLASITCLMIHNRSQGCAKTHISYLLKSTEKKTYRDLSCFISNKALGELKHLECF